MRLGRIERPPLAPEASALSVELQARVTLIFFHRKTRASLGFLLIYNPREAKAGANYLYFYFKKICASPRQPYFAPMLSHGGFAGF